MNQCATDWKAHFIIYVSLYIMCLDCIVSSMLFGSVKFPWEHVKN